MSMSVSQELDLTQKELHIADDKFVCETPLAPANNHSDHLTVIKPRAGWQIVDFAELWAYRELLYFLTWRDIKVRYKQSVLGATWAILQPLATMIVFSLFFGRVGKMPSGDFPYPLFVLAGLLPWFFFANSLTSASQSIVGNQNLVTKVYFPRLMIPMGAVAAGLVDLIISFLLLVVMMVFYGVAPGIQFLLLPFLTLGLLATTLGIGILLSALTVKYRDFKHIVPFMVQLWMFMTPAIYLNSAEALSPRLETILPLNPVYGLIINFRAAALGSDLNPYALAVSGAVSLLLLVYGCWYFRSVERGFADII